MRQFLKTIVLFVIPIALVTLGFETYLRTMNTDYKKKITGLEANYENIELLALGNSHAYNDVDPRQFDIEAYNMAGSNQSIYFDKRITLKHVDRLTQLKYVLISVDYHSLSFSSQGLRDTWVYYDYDIKYKDKNEFWTSLSYFWFGYTPRITISIIKTKFLDWYRGNTKNNQVIKGWMPQYGVDESAFTSKSIKNRAKYFNREVKNSTEREEIIADLDDFILQLKQKNITPILFTPPMYKEVYTHLVSEYRDQNAKDIKALVNKHDIEYWDFSDEHYDKSLFHNNDHLNDEGAAVFSKKLNAMLQKK